MTLFKNINGKCHNSVRVSIQATTLCTYERKFDLRQILAVLGPGKLVLEGGKQEESYGYYAPQEIPVIIGDNLPFLLIYYPKGIGI